MRIVLSLMIASVLTLVLIGSAAGREDKKDEKSPLPGPATWDIKAFDALFRIVRTDAERGAKQVKWTVQTRDGHRTSDFVRDLTRKPFAFRFLDGDDKELATIQLGKADFQGIPRSNVMKAGTRLTITLDLPKAMPKTKKVVLPARRIVIGRSELDALAERLKEQIAAYRGEAVVAQPQHAEAAQTRRAGQPRCRVIAEPISLQVQLGQAAQVRRFLQRREVYPREAIARQHQAGELMNRRCLKERARSPQLIVAQIQRVEMRQQRRFRQMREAARRHVR